MLKPFFFRSEDYWLIVASLLAILSMTAFFYAGVLQIRLIAALFGLSGLLFTTYIVRRSYSRGRSYVHLVTCLVASGLLAFGAYLLTN